MIQALSFASSICLFLYLWLHDLRSVWGYQWSNGSCNRALGTCMQKFREGTCKHFSVNIMTLYICYRPGWGLRCPQQAQQVDQVASASFPPSYLLLASLVLYMSVVVSILHLLCFLFPSPPQAVTALAGACVRNASGINLICFAGLSASVFGTRICSLPI